MTAVGLPHMVAVWPTLWRVTRAMMGLPPLLMILSLCWYYWQNRHLHAAGKKLTVDNTIRALPLIGHGYRLCWGTVNMINTLICVTRDSLAKGIYTVCLWIGPYPIFFIQRPEDIHTVITSSKTSEKSSEYDFWKFALGNGLLIAPGHIHRITRRHVNAMFMPRNLEQLMPVFNESGRHLVRDLSRHVGCGHVDIFDDVTIAALRNVSCVILGTDIPIDTKSTEFQGLFWAVKCIASVGQDRFFKIWLWSEFVFQFLYRKKIAEINRCWRTFLQEPLRMLQKKRNQSSQSHYDNKNLPGNEKSESSSKTPLNLSDTYKVLQENHPGFTDKDLHNEMLTLVVTGTDSTKCATSSCLLSLAAHPDIQERVYQEIVTVAGAEDKDLTLQEINDMPYLDQILKETLRKYTIIPVIMRTVKEDLQLSDVIVPKGGSVAVYINGMHLDPNAFPDPQKFDPERFSPENMVKLKRYSYLPFSGGSRNCVGKAYASMVIKTMVVHVLRHFRLTTNMDITNLTYNVALAMYSHLGYHMELTNRLEMSK